MGRWKGLQVITKELREDAGVPLDEHVGRMMREAAEAQGYHPASDPVLTWHEITQHEVDLEKSVNGYAYFAAGDWRVRCVMEVLEDAEIS